MQKLFTRIKIKEIWKLLFDEEFAQLISDFIKLFESTLYALKITQ